MKPNNINVAVVDDDESFARAMERLFRASGFAVRTYPSAEAFLAATPRPELECLVLDIQLGGMSGLELQQHLRGLGATQPVIFVTAHDVPDIRAAAEHGGCAAYFSKPVHGKSIIDAITNALDRNRGEGPMPTP